ncbi:hypothetical protein N7492_005447 [Penicillium capsulatum]|uniref:Uncharacterized protein n=1 Tax=Penicillium capsulatum TaxID=69766 RepID=A0A9W9LR08_9EURO|nr:hypothetical protein N7492_005447 [Penicillium capsulatum]KAJ6135452.1 hypothetical protein N7512_000612 [Penicillium capsulatum]
MVASRILKHADQPNSTRGRLDTGITATTDRELKHLSGAVLEGFQRLLLLAHIAEDQNETMEQNAARAVHGLLDTSVDRYTIIGNVIFLDEKIVPAVHKACQDLAASIRRLGGWLQDLEDVGCVFPRCIRHIYRTVSNLVSVSVILGGSLAQIRILVGAVRHRLYAMLA